MTKIPSRLMLLVITYVFFIVISLPLNYVMSSAIGVENSTAIMSALYIILTGVTFGLIFYKDFY